MPDTSTYAKIRDIVATVRRLRRCGIDNLASELIARASKEENGFVYYRKNPRGIVESSPCSEATIRRHVRFCQEIDFLTQETDISLSEAAQRAKSKVDFDTILETQIIDFLARRKITIADVERAIGGTKTSDPETIYGMLADKTISEDKFRSCLNLLSIVGDTIVPYRKKMYLVNG